MDNFNITTTQDQADEAHGLVPGGGGLNVGDMIAKNALTQAQQEQLVQQAIEHTKQAKIGTSEAETELDTKGFLSEKGQVPKAQALSELKLMLKKEEWEQPDIDKAVAEAETTWPEVVNAYDIRGFVSALRQEHQSTPTKGTPFQATEADGKKKDENNDPLVSGQWYTATGDGDYIRSGEPAAIGKGAGKEAADAEKQWQKLGQQIEGAIKSRYGVVGQVGTTISRADRAINTITHSQGADGMLSKQDIENISTDIAAIYQGGVPSITQIVENSYGTTLTNMMETLRHYTGFLSHLGNSQVLAQTKAKLMQVLSDMRNSGLAQIEKFVEMQFPFYRPLLQSDPERWDQVKQAVMAFMSSGLINTSGQVSQPTGSPEKAPVGEQPVGAGALKTPSGIAYTVGE